MTPVTLIPKKLKLMLCLLGNVETYLNTQSKRNVHEIEKKLNRKLVK